MARGTRCELTLVADAKRCWRWIKVQYHVPLEIVQASLHESLCLPSHALLWWKGGRRQPLQNPGPSVLVHSLSRDQPAHVRSGPARLSHTLIELLQIEVFVAVR
jgi:hypothetical protein